MGQPVPVGAAAADNRTLHQLLAHLISAKTKRADADLAVLRGLNRAVDGQLQTGNETVREQM